MFRCEFSNFLECALDVRWSLEMTLRLVDVIKGERVTRSVVPLVIIVSPAKMDN